MAGEDIFKQFREHSVAEFFKKNRQMLGFSGKVRSLTMIAHEFVTNSVSWDTPTVVRIDGRVQVRKIGELVDDLAIHNPVERSPDGELESVRRFGGFEVLCFSKDYLKVGFKAVKSVHRHAMKEGEKILMVRLVGGRSVEMTRHHSAFTLKDGMVVPHKGGDIRVGDHLVVPRKPWAGIGQMKEINLIEEALRLADGELGEFSIFGVKEILYSNRPILDKLKAPLSLYQRNHDFYANYMKCDRLPVKLLRHLEPDERTVFYGCKVGYKRGRHGWVPCVLPLSQELMQLLGLYVAEGNTRKTLTSVSLSFGSHETQLIGTAKRLVKTVFGLNALVQPAHKTAVNVVISSKTVAFLLASIFKCGKSAKEKIVPEIVFNVAPEMAMEFMNGYLAGDGYPSAEFAARLEGDGTEIKSKITLATASRGLATNLEYLLSSLGYAYSRQLNPAENRKIAGKMASFSESHVIEFYPLQERSALEFYPMDIGGVTAVEDPQLVWALKARGQQTLTYSKAIILQGRGIELTKEAAGFIAGDLGVLQVASVEEREPDKGEYVYDYSVEGDENFVGGHGAICLHNSLDACEEAGILPEIFVQVEELEKDSDHYRMTIRDNGPGIPKTHLGKALGQMLAGTKFHRYLQQRGQQGIGASACVMFSYLTTGQPTRADLHPQGQEAHGRHQHGFQEQQAHPRGDKRGGRAPEGESGLCVIAQFKEVRYERSNYGVYEYLRRTALANPHCAITLIEPTGLQTVFPRSVAANPKRPFEIKPHPLGIGTHDLLEFSKHNRENRKISAFLQNEFSRVSAAKVEELRSLVPEVNFDKDPQRLEWSEAEKIVKAFSQVKWIAPTMDSLVPIGREQVELSFRNIFNPDVLVVTERSPKVYRGGIPFMVEVGIAYGGGLVAAEKRGEVMRFANRVPLLFDSGGCAITETIKAMDWSRYDLKNFDEEPVAVLVNLVSVHVPYTSAGKQAISNEEDVMEEIKLAIMEASRGVQKYISGKKKAHDIATKKKVIGRYTQQLARDLAALSGEKREKIEASLSKIIEEKYSGPEGLEEEGAAEAAKETSQESEGGDGE